MPVVSSITPQANVTLVATTTSSNVLIPITGTPTVLLLSNFSDSIVFVALGSSNAVVAINGNTPVMPRSQLALAVGSFTYIAAIALNGTAALNITTSI